MNAGPPFHVSPSCNNETRLVRFVLSAEETTAVQTFLTKPKKTQDAKMVIGGMGGRSSNSDRRAAGSSSSSKKKGPLGETVGDRLEVSGESILLVKEVAERIAQDGCVGARFLVNRLSTDCSRLFWFLCGKEHMDVCSFRDLELFLRLSVVVRTTLFSMRCSGDGWLSGRMCHGRV